METAGLGRDEVEQGTSKRCTDRQRQTTVSHGEPRDVLVPVLQRARLPKGMFVGSQRLKQVVIAGDGAEARVRKDKNIAMPTCLQHRACAVGRLDTQQKRIELGASTGPFRDRVTAVD